ncbi:MAG TPA: L,D-transpeptidase family protein [Sphingomicrobium sp.]|nr:L,D-transpeptidase family protein [Sphingomicrobium sp.]
MKASLKRALCAALLLTAVPTVASAEDTDRNNYPAIATGMAIPGGAAAVVAGIPMRGRSVLVDAASARLYMIEDGQIRDSMRVIVGKPDAATPELRTQLSYATLNPYWHVPTDLARTLTAPNVLKHGVSYLHDRGYEVVSSFGPGGRVIDPESVDWEAVADGREIAYVRQRPGPANSMGEMKFSLASGGQIYLHDTPRKELFQAADRNLSAGCVRLEDAERFAEWLLGDEPDVASAAPEQHVPVPGSVPITITYLDQQAQMTLASLQY